MFGEVLVWAFALVLGGSWCVVFMVLSFKRWRLGLGESWFVLVCLGWSLLVGTKGRSRRKRHQILHYFIWEKSNIDKSIFYRKPQKPMKNRALACFGYPKTIFLIKEYESLLFSTGFPCPCYPHLTLSPSPSHWLSSRLRSLEKRQTPHPSSRRSPSPRDVAG